MARSYSAMRRVEFRETDAAGICHFSSFFGYMEEAEHALLRDIGLSVVMQDEGRTISWPRVNASCDYIGAALFEDVLQVEVGISRLGQKSVTYQFKFSKDNKVVANGTMTSVCCIMHTGDAPEAIQIPHSIGQLLEPYVEAPEEEVKDD
ncbi:MAG: acyl-CoA thioester hydrolase [Pirellulaceae bacterium]|jgi:acyl-CoA thioester hydrolase